MPTDLFLALKDPRNPRGHPILTALLYSYCPAAARWWLAGADPQPPFDPVWQALEDQVQGGVLKDVLRGYGYDKWLDLAKQYIEQVEAYRRLHPDVVSPERLPFFTGGRTTVRMRFEMQHAIDKLGGAWQNFFVYVRTWAFLIPDWGRAVKFSIPAEFKAARLAFTLSGIRRPVYFPAWQWVGYKEKKSGLVVKRIVLGALTAGLEQDQLRYSLILRAVPDGEPPWEIAPEVWSLDRNTGQAARFEAHLPDGLERLIQRLAELAESHPSPPANALQRPAHCAYCGYRAQCYDKEGLATPLALGF